MCWNFGKDLGCSLTFRSTTLPLTFPFFSFFRAREERAGPLDDHGYSIQYRSKHGSFLDGARQCEKLGGFKVIMQEHYRSQVPLGGRYIFNVIVIPRAIVQCPSRF